MNTWISVKRKLPEDFREVLTIDKNGLINIRCFMGRTPIDWSPAKTEVTHWMFLPDKPKENVEDMLDYDEKLTSKGAVMNNFEQWKNNLSLDDLQNLAVNEFSCDICPAGDMCDCASYDSCMNTLHEWATQDVEVDVDANEKLEVKLEEEDDLEKPNELEVEKDWMPTKETVFYYVDIDGNVRWRDGFIPKYDVSDLLLLFMKNYFPNFQAAGAHAYEMKKKYELIYNLGMEGEKDE